MRRLPAPKPPDAVSDFAKDESVDFSQLLQWTMRNINEDPDSLLPEDMPYPACREMLRWARTDRKNFWPYVAKFDLKSKEQIDQQRKFEDDKRKHFKLFDKLIEYWEQHPEKDATVVADPLPNQAHAT